MSKHNSKITFTDFLFILVLAGSVILIAGIGDYVVKSRTAKPPSKPPAGLPVPDREPRGKDH